MKKIFVIISTIAAFAMSGTAFAGNYGAQNNNELAYLHMFEGSPYSTDCYQLTSKCKPVKSKCHAPAPRCAPKPPVVSCKPRCAPKPPKAMPCQPRQPKCAPKPLPPRVDQCGNTQCDTFGYAGSGKRYDRYGRRVQ